MLPSTKLRLPECCCSFACYEPIILASKCCRFNWFPMVVLTTATAQLPPFPSSLCLVASCPTYKVGVSKTSCDAAKKSPPKSEGKVIQRRGSSWSNSMILCSYCKYMYVYHIHVFSCIGNILRSHPYFQHLFSPKNSTCPISNTSLLLQKEPQRLLRADSLGSFVVFGTDSMGASASLKAAKLCLGWREAKQPSRWTANICCSW